MKNYRGKMRKWAQVWPSGYLPVALLGLVLCFVFSLCLMNSEAFATSEEENKATAEVIIDEQSSWLFGKIEPDLEEESSTTASLDVIIHINGTDLDSAAEAVKNSYGQKLEGLSENIKGMLQKYRPTKSLTEEEEKAFAAQMESMMTSEDKESLKALRREHDASMDQMRNEIGLVLKGEVEADQAELKDLIESLGGTVTREISVMNILGATIPSGELAALAQNDLVASIMKDRLKELELNNSIPSVSYNTWWNDALSLDGGAYDFGIAEGAQSGHPSLSSHTFYIRPGTTAASHGTHVTGIAASTHATYRGGAFGLDAVISADTGTNQSGVMADMDWMAASALQGPEVINHSLGYGTANDVDYSSNDAFYDAFVTRYNIMVTKSAGNNGWGTTPTITHPAPAYNILVVANMNDMNTLTRSDDVRASTSSTGPTLNGRKKPDISAPGTDIISTANTTTDSFVSMSGTSMAAPHVAAAIVLMEDGGNHTPMAQKAVLLNTADAWTSNNTSGTSDDGSVNGSYWDKSYGWGYLDMWEAHFNRTDYFTGSLVPNNYNATPDDYKLYSGYMYTDEKATLVWQKRSAGYQSNAGPTTNYALSDIDLALYREDTGAFMDSDTAISDNVHQVAANTSGTAVVKVYSYSSSFAGATTESFALATEENFAAVSPPSFTVALTAPSSANTNSTFSVTANVTNNGGAASFNNMVTLSLPAGFSLVSGTNPQNIGRISAGGTGTATWTVSAPSTAGSRTLSAGNSSSSYGETYTGSGNRSINIILVQPAITSPTPGSTLSGSSATFCWTSNGQPIQEYYLYVGDTGVGSNNIYWGSQGLATCKLVTGLPTDGRIIYVKFWFRIAGVWSYINYQYTAYSAALPAITSPTPGSTLTSSSATFCWTSNGHPVVQYWLSVGDTGVGSINIYHADQGLGTCRTVSGLPVDGRTLNVKLWWKIGTVWASANYIYTAHTAAVTLPEIYSPTPGSTLTSSSETFMWRSNGAPVSQYWLYVGDTGAGSQNIYSGGQALNTSRTISALPTDGRTLNVRLWWQISGLWSWADYTYTAFTTSVTPPDIITPAGGSTLSGSSVAFTWTTNGTPVTSWYLWAGPCSSNTFGGCGDDYFNSGALSAGTSSTTVTGLPTNGSTVYVRLWYQTGGVWLSILKTYTASGGGVLPPSITSPTPGSVLSCGSASFTWTSNGTAVTEWWLWVGTTPGGQNIVNTGSLGTSLTRTVTGLPSGSVPVYVRLWYRVSGTWLYRDFIYTSCP